MNLDSLKERLEEAVKNATFRNVFGQEFGYAVLSDSYSRKMREHRLSDRGDTITVKGMALTHLVSELDPLLDPYKSPNFGLIGNGLYLFAGSAASPRFPSVEDYAKILIIAAAKIGSERVINLFSGWLEDKPIRIHLCTLLKGIETQQPLSSINGMRLDTLPTNMSDFPRSLYFRLNPGRIEHEQYAKRAILTIEYDVGPALYKPEEEKEDYIRSLISRKIVNQKLPSIKSDQLYWAMSLAINNYVDWFMHWEDFGELDAFFYNAGYGTQRKETKSPSPVIISDDDLRRALSLYSLLEKFTKLNLSIRRWRRSKQSSLNGRELNEEVLIELRIALEAVLFADEKGVVAEKRQRLAIRGAWLLGETFEQREEYLRTLKKVYVDASKVIHAGNIKPGKIKEINKTIAEAQNLCRKAILKILEMKKLPNWTDLILGKDVRKITS